MSEETVNFLFYGLELNSDHVSLFSQIKVERRRPTILVKLRWSRKKLIYLFLFIFVSVMTDLGHFDDDDALDYY